MLKKYVIGATINDHDLYVEFTPEGMNIILDGEKEKFLISSERLSKKLIKMMVYANREIEAEEANK